MGQTQTLIDGIQCLIEAANEPLSEYQLIQQLNEQGWSLSTDASNSLALFTSHFLVFNALYQLQTHYWNSQTGYLTISALHIRFHAFSENTELDKRIADKNLQNYSGDAALRDYYLDLSHLEQATDDSVDALLTQFWEKFIASGDQGHDEQNKALAIFSLEPPVTISVVKQRYRQLAMKYHPDRGGKVETFQELNWAFGVLQRVSHA